jgi:hypothetical protein
MALLTTQQITKAGTAPSYVAVAASDTITADTDLFLHVKNANGSPDTVTLVDAGTTPAGSAATSPTVSVPASTGDRMIAIPQALVNPATGLITITHSVTTSVTCALMRLG